MEEKINNFVRFFQDQVEEELREYNRLKSVPVETLFREDRLHWGTIHGVNHSNGHIIIKIRKGFAPRLKVMRSFVLVTNTVKNELGYNPRYWRISFEEFIRTSKFHTGHSDLLPLYFISKHDEKYDYIGCTSVTLKIFSSITNLLDAGKELMILLFEPFPPTDYLKNIAHYTQLNKDEPLLHVEPKMAYEDWNPHELAFNANEPFRITEEIRNKLEEKSICIVQGPPGTGKSYTIAQIVSKYLEENKSVCVTTMANKGLLELVKQPPLKKFLEDKRVYKTRLTSDESKEVSGLQSVDTNLIARQGTLLCATNYVLSSLFNEDNIYAIDKAHYDLIIIEEASQAFLSTIVAFKDLANKCLIVGDPMQLPPIVKNIDDIKYKTWKAYLQYNGFVNLALGTDIKSYRIITSFRLSPKSTEQTGVFYNNSLISVQNERVDFSLIDSPLFPSEGGAIINYTNSGTDGICSPVALQIMHSVVNAITQKYPAYEVAIITPFRDTVKVLQKEFYTDIQNLDITVETIDRIQGMTVDYSIVYFPLNNISFALSENRFNVATSRSKSTTLIISDVNFNALPAIPNKTADFLSTCNNVIFQIDKDTSVENLSTVKENKQQTAEISPPGVKVIGRIDLSVFERNKPEIIDGKDNLYVIDTNVFVDNPEIISRIDKKYPVILSAKVIDELDSLKVRLDEKGKLSVQRALKSINDQMKKRDVRMEFSNLDLLPIEFDKRSPDNMILTVALKFKDENPILLTSDIGLQVKAKGLGLTTISLRDFLRNK